MFYEDVSSDKQLNMFFFGRVSESNHQFSEVVFDGHLSKCLPPNITLKKRWFSSGSILGLDVRWMGLHTDFRGMTIQDFRGFKL